MEKDRFKDNHADPSTVTPGLSGFEQVGSFGPVPATQQPRNHGQVLDPAAHNVTVPSVPEPCAGYQHDLKR